MTIDELFGPDGTEPLPPLPVLADPLAGLVTGEFLAADVLAADAAWTPTVIPVTQRTTTPRRRRVAPPKPKASTENWSYAPPEFAPAPFGGVRGTARTPAPIAMATATARTPRPVRAATATGVTPAAIRPGRAPAKPASAVARPAPGSGRKPGVRTPVRGGDSTVRGGAARTVRKRRSGGGIVTTIIVIIVLVLIYFGSGIVHLVTHLIH